MPTVLSCPILASSQKKEERKKSFYNCHGSTRVIFSDRHTQLRIYATANHTKFHVCMMYSKNSLIKNKKQLF